MATIRCRSCGRIYDYNKQDMCPKCGAYNRPPHRERVDPDGTVHFVEDQSIPPRRGKVCYEERPAMRIRPAAAPVRKPPTAGPAAPAHRSGRTPRTAPTAP